MIRWLLGDELLKLPLYLLLASSIKF